jgi:hypothetical protein
LESRIEESEIMINAIPIDSDLCLAAHKHSTHHRAEIEASPRCGCFFCFRTFRSSDIKAWIDASQTALCPTCGVDSVIGSASNHRLDDAFLRGMHARFFASQKKKK